MFVEGMCFVMKSYKFNPEKKRKTLGEKQIIQQGELAKIIAKRAGVPQRDTYEVLKAFPEIVIEYSLKGYVVNIDRFGNFYLKDVLVPSYSYKEKVGTGMKKRYTLKYKPAKYLATEINDLLLGEEEEVDE